MKRIITIYFFLLVVGLAQTSRQQAIQTYADIVFASYQDTLKLTRDLQDATNKFLLSPSQESMDRAKNAWLAVREVYGQTEAYRFYGGPIDNENGPEGLINAWPLDEAYIDYVKGSPDSGIINNPGDYPNINKLLLISLNEVGAEENVAAGFHAIEFLLWGQDERNEGAGQRDYTDYTTAANAERRGQYLRVATELLLENLQELVDAWNPEVAGNYRESFLALEPDIALQNILTGIGVLAKSELAGERIFTAYDNQDQEDEHSCFSDNTHRDIATNFKGIKNVYLGSYVRSNGDVIKGTGVSDVVNDINPELNSQTLVLFEQASQQVQNLFIPFDQAIIKDETRPQILSLVSSLLDLGDNIAAIGNELGLTINTALPE